MNKDADRTTGLEPANASSQSDIEFRRWIISCLSQTCDTLDQIISEVHQAASKARIEACVIRLEALSERIRCR
jgi:hypothetical protein